MITIAGIAAQFTELMLAVLLAPLFTGWVNMCRAWLQNKSAPPLLTPYRVLLKLFNKEPVLEWRPAMASGSPLAAGCNSTGSVA